MLHVIPKPIQVDSNAMHLIKISKCTRSVALCTLENLLRNLYEIGMPSSKFKIFRISSSVLMKSPDLYASSQMKTKSSRGGGYRS